jgi:mono/diheme cytochrome c family protein
MRTVLNLVGMTAVAASLCLAGMAMPARAQDAPAGDAAEGKRIYSAVGCFFCHGHSGQGGNMNGPAPIIAKTQMPWEGFVNQLRNPSNEMPAYVESVMPEKQLADIYAFLQSLPGPLPNAKQMPVFKD